MPSVRGVAALVFLLCTAACPAAPPGPYVALRVDYHAADPVPADSGSKTATSKLGEQRGSGVVVGPAGSDSWFVLTNAHVVETGPEIGRAVPQVFAGGQWRAGRIVAEDPEADLALVRIRFSEELRAAEVATASPDNRVKVSTHGFAGGTKYCRRTAELRHALPLRGGALAWATHRYFVQTTFDPGESGGAVTSEGRLVGLIHGNDPAAGWGLVVDYVAIEKFLEPYRNDRQPTPAE